MNPSLMLCCKCAGWKRDGAGQKGMSSEAPPPSCTPPSQVDNIPRGEVQRSLRPSQDASLHPRNRSHCPDWGPLPPIPSEFSPHLWTLSPLEASLRGLGFSYLGWNPGLARVLHTLCHGVPELWVLAKALYTPKVWRNDQGLQAPSLKTGSWALAPYCWNI